MSFLSVVIDEQTLPITLKRQAYRRSIRLQYRNQAFTVTAPQTLLLSKIEDFLHSQKAWIKKRLTQDKQKTLLPELGFNEDTKRAAKILILGKITELKSDYPFAYKGITIKNLNSKWGSCSAKKNLNFNYRLIALPEHLVTYIVVHELCHLKELNHSQRFWDLVAKVCPNYRQLRKELHQIDFQTIQ